MVEPQLRIAFLLVVHIQLKVVAVSIGILINNASVFEWDDAASLDEQSWALNMDLNLRAPVMVNLTRRLGRQIITVDEQPLQLVLPSAPVHLRKSA